MCLESSSQRPPTLAAIKALIQSSSFEELPELLGALEHDERAGVRKLVAAAQSRHDRESAERQRVQRMYSLMDELAGSEGIVLGVDEVGRGSVAGPLTVAAVTLPRDPIIWGLNDSKLLSPARREELAALIQQVSPAIGIAHIEPNEIDACGMAASLRLAMRRAIAATGVEPSCVLIDGLPVQVHPCEVAVTHGDARIACIAAASIVAKVTRDAIMVEADARYPGYGFAKSKGYGSAEHQAAIQTLGLSPYHRATFCHNFLEGSK